MPKSVNVTLYTIDELSDKAKERAREWFRGLDATADVDMLEETFLSDLVDWVGLGNAEQVKVRFALTHCQGDGVVFGTQYVNVPHLLKCQHDLHEQVRTLREKGDKYADKAARFCIDRDTLETMQTLERQGVQYRMSISFGKDLNESQMRVSLDTHNYGTADVDDTSETVFVLADVLTSWAQSVARGLKDQGYAELEHLNSDEAVDDTLRLNEFMFTKDGKNFRHIV